MRLPAAGDGGDAAAGRHGEDRAGAGLGARHRPLQQQVHKSGAAEAGEVARNQAPPHRLDWQINAMFIYTWYTGK